MDSDPVTPDPDAEVPLLPLLLEQLRTRDLVPEDFPDGQALEWPEQIQIIERALALGRERCAVLLAIPCGFPARQRGGRVEWHLRRWMRLMAQARCWATAGARDAPVVPAVPPVVPEV